jgi:hypothetical protein
MTDSGAFTFFAKPYSWDVHQKNGNPYIEKYVVSTR